MNLARRTRGLRWTCLTLIVLGPLGCDGGGTPFDPCSPNPCTAVPDPACQDNSVVTFRPVCTPEGGQPACSSTVAGSTSCGAQRCDPESVSCVACLEDADCPVPGMTCQGHVCVGTCAPDAREANDSAAQATALHGAEDWPGLTVCEGDQDWFRIPLTAGARLQATIAFGHAAGDLSLALLGPDGSTVLASSQSTDDDEQIDHTLAADGTCYLQVTVAPGQWNAYRLTVQVTGGSDPCMPDPCTAIPEPACQGEQLSLYGSECADVGGAAECSYPVEETIDCAAQGSHCHPTLGACAACVEDGHCQAGQVCTNGTCGADPCSPDPCTAIPEPECLGEALITYRGECSVTAGQAVCAYPVDGQQDCALTGQRCDEAAGACVDCLSDADCEPPFEVCDLGACAPGCQDDPREPNDDDAAATSISANTALHDLVLCAGDEDWFSFPLVVGDALIATAAFDGSHGDLDLYLLAADGTTELASSTGAASPAALAYTVPAGQAGTVYLRVVGAGAAEQALYDLTTSTTGDPCLPDPCTDLPDPICSGEELVTYRGQCTPVGGLPTCTYPEDARQDCAATGLLCDPADPSCVECLADSDCAWPFEQCQARACAAGCQDDGSEPNDDAGQATDLPPDVPLVDRVLCGDDHDWYRIQAGVGDTLEALITFSHAAGNLDLDLVGPDQATVVASSHGVADDELVSYEVPVGGAGWYHLHVQGVAGAQNTYELLATISDDPCNPNPCTELPAERCEGELWITYTVECTPDGSGGAICAYPEVPTDCALTGERCDPASPGCVDCLTDADCAWPFEVCQAQVCSAGCQDDSSEPNDDTATATSLTAGAALTDRVLCPASADYYAIILQPEETLRVSLAFLHAQGDLSLEILGPDGSTVLASSQTTGDGELAAAVQPAPAASELWVRVFGATAGAGNVYAISVQILPDPCVPNPCTAVPGPACVGTRAVTYRAECTNDLGTADCSYPEDTSQDCSLTGALCQAAACVGRYAVAGDLVITEMMYNTDAVTDEVGEWLELQNLAAEPVNLRGIRFEDGAATPNFFTVSTDLMVPPGDYALLGFNADVGINGGVALDYVYPPSFQLNNSGGDTVTLLRDSVLVEEASYCLGAAPCLSGSTIGASAQLDPGHVDPVSNDLPEYWCLTPAGVVYGLGDRGTPGAPNEPCGTNTYTLGWCRVQWPDTPLTPAAGDPIEVFSRVWIDGLTNVDPIGVDAAPELVVELGHGPTTADPTVDPGSWTWSGAWPNPGWDGTAAGEPNNDEYQGGFLAPSTGSYHFAFRYSGDHGATWTYCDWDGFWDGAQTPTMTVP